MASCYLSFNYHSCLVMEPIHVVMLVLWDYAPMPLPNLFMSSYVICRVMCESVRLCHYGTYLCLVM
jgi:hypothetical protein